MADHVRLRTFDLLTQQPADGAARHEIVRRRCGVIFGEGSTVLCQGRRRQGHHRVSDSWSASMTYSDASFQICQEADASLPWSKTIEANTGSTFVMNAHHIDGYGSTACTMDYEGRVIGTNTSSGEYAVVTYNRTVD